MIVSLLLLTLLGMMAGTQDLACIFPFVYEGHSFSSCIPNGREDRKYWCATTSAYDRDKEWVFCPAADLPGSSTVALCNFPFIFNRKRYFSCTIEGRSDGRYWCATTGDYDHDKQWVFCSDSDYGKLRLANGPNSCSGRLEIFLSSHWGTVCNSNWSMHTAEVICRQLGCGHAQSAEGAAYFGEGKGPVWMDRVVCTGAESSLWQCSSKTKDEHRCSHKQDAGVTCSGAVQLDAQEDTNLISPLIPVICGLLGVLCIAAVAWIIKRKRENQRTGLHVALTEVSSKNKELEGAPESLYENIDDLRNTNDNSPGKITR